MVVRENRLTLQCTDFFHLNLPSHGSRPKDLYIPKVNLTLSKGNHEVIIWYGISLMKCRECMMK